jgi:radical SAM enzyme (TIGR01210 family)
VAERSSFNPRPKETAEIVANRATACDWRKNNSHFHQLGLPIASSATSSWHFAARGREEVSGDKFPATTFPKDQRRRMSDDRAVQQILIGSEKAGKTYEFDERHDRSRPAQMWFQESIEGLVLFVVFYSQACRWSRCLGCNLPSKMSRDHVGYRSLIAQINHLFSDPEVLQRRDSIRKVIVSNNGSVLDEATFSSTALIYLLAQLNLNLPDVAVLSLETRPEYVDIAELEFISRVLAEGDTPTQLEIAVGFEAFDDDIRNNVFHKGMTLDTFESLVKKMAPYGFHLKCYFMQKPVPGMSDADAVADIQRGIDYLGRIALEHRLPVNLHLNPTYVAGGTVIEHAFREGRYAPPRLRDVAEAARHARNQPVTVFLGLHTEGLALEGGSFIRPGEDDLVAQLELFNRTQDYNILDRICETGRP